MSRNCLVSTSHMHFDLKKDVAKSVMQAALGAEDPCDGVGSKNGGFTTKEYDWNYVVSSKLVYYEKAREDPMLSAREFLQMELNPTVETLAPLRKHLKKVNEDFLALGKPQEETIAKVHPVIVKRLLCLALGKEVEKEYVGITLGHERIRLILNDLM